MIIELLSVIRRKGHPDTAIISIDNDTTYIRLPLHQKVTVPHETNVRMYTYVNSTTVQQRRNITDIINT